MPGLCFEYLPLPDGGARLIRLYGETPCPVLPDTLDGHPLTELGPYCFAPRQRTRLLPPQDALRRCRCGAAPRGKYDFEDEPEPSALPRIAGSFLEEITLPDSLRLIGEAAFYDCRSLRQICMGSGTDLLGSDALTNTLALSRLTVRAAPTTPTGLYRVLEALRGEISVAFAPDETTIQAVLWYPEYWEEVEETPSHMLVPSFSSRGYHYRQCFAQGAPAFAEYDAVLARTGADDAPATLAMLAFDRLRYPVALTPQAAARYRAYLSTNDHGVLCAKRLLDAQDPGALRTLLALELLDADALRQIAALAAQAENAEAAALAANALRGKTRRKRYEF